MRIPAQRPGAKLDFTFGPWDNGINEKADPGTLGPADLRAAVNVLLDETPGQAWKRWGNQEVALLPSGLPPKFGYVFKKNDGTEYLLLSDGTTIYVTTDLVTITQLVTGLDDTAYLQFETAEGKCWISNGTDSTMWYDGTTLVALDREYGDAVLAVADAGTDGTHIVDAALTSAVTDYWKDRKVVITSGTAIGKEGTVTAFDPASDTLTITPELVGLTTGDSYKVGLIMPKARIMRYGTGTLFLGGTSENRSGIRFNRPDNVDTGIRMSLDNPSAWPTNYEISITQDDGDQVWSFSPAYKNRVLVTKGTAIYRLEPDSTYQFVAVLVSAQVGCRYPDSWAVKNELLHFMGNEQSGLLDLYITDMVSVKPRHKDGNLLPSFQEMYRSEPLYKYIARASTDQFNTGEKSTLCETGNGRLECRNIGTKAGWDEIRTAAVDTAVSEALETVTINGIPAWPQKYEANELPAAATPAWTKAVDGATSEAITDGKLINTTASFAAIFYYRNGVLDASKNSFISLRLKRSATAGLQVYFQNGSKGLWVDFSSSGIGILAWPAARVYVAGDTASDYKTINILLDKDGLASVYAAGARVWTGTAGTATAHPAYGITTNAIGYSSAGGTGYLDFIYEDLDFAFTAAQLGATIPTAGSVTVKIDYLRTPEAFGKYWFTLGNDFSGTAATGTDAAHIVDALLTGEDNFWNGRYVTITSGTYAGASGLVTAYDSATHKLTISGLPGDPGIGETFKINRGGTLGIETQSSADDITYGALAALTNGGEPAVDNANSLNRYLKLVLTLTRADVANGPELAEMIGGFLWRMTGQQVGVNISAWRKYLDEITVPSGAALVTKIRLATTITTPIESDWGAWQTIVTTNNIGTILSDVTFPVTVGQGRWLDVKVEGGPSAYGVTPNLENFLLNWQQGSSSRLAITSFVYKKRLYVTGISSTAAANDRLFVLDTNQAWTKILGQSLNRIVTFKGLIYGLSSIDDKIYQQEVEGKHTDGLVDVNAYIDPAAMDFGHQRFEITNIKVGSAAIVSNVTVYLSYDGVTFTSIGTLAFTGSGTKNLRVPHGRIGKRHFIRLQVPGNEGMAINMLKVSGRTKAEE